MVRELHRNLSNQLYKSAIAATPSSPTFNNFIITTIFLQTNTERHSGYYFAVVMIMVCFIRITLTDPCYARYLMLCVQPESRNFLRVIAGSDSAQIESISFSSPVLHNMRGELGIA